MNSEITSDANIHLRCVRCGYQLRGLGEISRCPECGLEIDRTLATNDLTQSDPAWVGRLASGAGLLVISCAASIIHFGLIYLLLVTSQLEPLRRYVSETVTLTAWIGWWLLAMPQPSQLRHLDPANRLRRAIRILIIFNVAMFALLMARWYGDRNVDLVLRLTEDALLISCIVVEFTYARCLARRMPDPFLLVHLPIAMTANLIAIVSVGILPVLSENFHLTGLQTSVQEGVLTEIIGAATPMYMGYVLFYFWRRLNAAAVESVANCNQSTRRPDEQI